MGRSSTGEMSSLILGMRKWRAIRVRYKSRAPNRINESAALKVPSWSNQPQRTTIASKIGKSVSAVVLPTKMGEMISVRPSTRPIFAILDPKALPTANSPAPDAAAETDTKISGAEVPRDTTVIPMISGDIPKRLATAAAPLINRSALQTKAAIPRTTTAKSKSIVFL